MKSLIVFVTLNSVLIVNVFCQFLDPKNPDNKKSFCEISEAAGFVCDKHTIDTSDGYILTAYHVTKEGVANNKKTVLFVHGFLGDSTNFIVNVAGDGMDSKTCSHEDQTVSDNMGFALVMFGYDCWFLQVRGAVDSTGHKTLNSNMREYWEFTTDEIAKYDMPAAIDYILTFTQKPNLTFIGHSQATKIVLQFLSTKTSYQEKMDQIIHIAPVARLGHTKSIFYRFFFPFLINNLLYVYGGPIPNVKILLEPLARIPGIAEIMWELLNFSLYGPVAPVDPKRIQVYISHLGGASMWNLVNLVRDAHKCISYFNYGPVKNLKQYNSITAPMYDIRKVNTKMVLIIGKNDFTTQKEDVDCIRSNVKNIVAEKEFDNMNHLNLFFGARACEVTKYVLEKLQ